MIYNRFCFMSKGVETMFFALTLLAAPVVLWLFVFAVSFLLRINERREDRARDKRITLD